MYSKIIKGKRYVTSDGQRIRVPMEFDHPEYNHMAGELVSNPRLELLIADGWEEWAPPIPEPQPQTEPSEFEKVAALNTLLATEIVALDDEAALQVISLFPTWISMIGEEVHKDERYYYNEKLWKVLKGHTVQNDWTPDTAHSLFVKVSVAEWPEIPEHIPSTNPFNTGDKGSWKGEHYICKIDGCVWNPDEYPAGWNKQ